MLRTNFHRSFPNIKLKLGKLEPNQLEWHKQIGNLQFYRDLDMNGTSKVEYR